MALKTCAIEIEASLALEALGVGFAENAALKSIFTAVALVVGGVEIVAGFAFVAGGLVGAVEAANQV